MSEENESGASNAVNPKVIKGFFNLAKGKIEELESLKGSYMANCKEIREELKDIKGRAKDSGIPLKVFNAGLKRIALEVAIKKIPDGLSEDNVGLYELTLDAVLGDYIDTPLGQAAAQAETSAQTSTKKGKFGPPKDALNSLVAANDDDKDLRPAFLKDKDAEASAANEAALAGLKQLPN